MLEGAGGGCAWCFPGLACVCGCEVEKCGVWDLDIRAS